MIDVKFRNFIEVDHHENAKRGQFVSGDIFLSQKIKGEDRIISVLADGLGSGIKASVLATLTSSMALKYTSSTTDIRSSAEIIMDTLPICSVRKISYSTFTIIDMDLSGKVRVIEHGNPPYSFWRNGMQIITDKQDITLPKWKDRLINYSELEMMLGDRIVFFSDGISQAGMGMPGTPLGWGNRGVSDHIAKCLKTDAEISAHDLARKIVKRAKEFDNGEALDDITCGVIYCRKPRQLLLVTGPPFARHRDEELALLVDSFPGKRVISGGTTTNIISRHLDRNVTTDFNFCCPGIPPGGYMDGADLITEGTLTLARVASMLEEEVVPEDAAGDPATALLSLLLDTDIVYFVVGTRINEAHQDPNIPVELDLRRNIIRRIAELLEKQHCKETQIKFV